MGKEPKKTLEELEAERLALEQEAYDDKNRMLKQSQFQELLELQTDEEPEFVEEIVAMFVDDAEAMLVELEELFAEGATRARARAAMNCEVGNAVPIAAGDRERSVLASLTGFRRRFSSDLGRR